MEGKLYGKEEHRIEAAKAASATMIDDRTAKKSKIAAASALSQVEKKPKAKTKKT